MKYVAILVILAFLAALLYPVFATAGVGNGKTACLSNIKQSTTACAIYQADNNGRFPLRDSWMDVIDVRYESLLHCSELQKANASMELYGYCFNAKLSSALQPDDPTTEILLFESVNLARNASGALDSLPNPGRHRGGNYVGFADGHAKWRKQP
jgi:prepilin-type processing-associated H-X9-DG protein